MSELDNLKLSVPEMASRLHELLGCAWGRTLGKTTDAAPCFEQATRIVVLHYGVDEAAFKLCPKHEELVYELTTPHEEAPTP